MSRISLYLPTNRIAALLVLMVLLVSCFPVAPLASAQEIPSNSNECADVILLFARGSGQNNTHKQIDDPLHPSFSQIEKESFAFFNWHKTHFDNDFPHISYKAVTIHDFPGKYDPVGYKAVGVGLGDIPNTINADASWVPGDYQQSVQHGIAETVGYLKDQIASCPDQYLMVGGYSQGAQVMGDALFQLTEQEQSKILGVGFFGDPKYVGSTEGLPTKVKPAISFPWRRGEATNKDAGMLEPRVPYVPYNMENRTLSWCSRYDIVCAGWSAFRKNSTHSNYSENPVRYIVNELVSIATPQLLALERNHGGVNGDVPATQISKADRDRQRDVMFLFNDNSNTDVIYTLGSIDPMLPQFVQSFTGTRFAAKAFGEHDFGFSAPRVDNIQSFLPLTGFNFSNPTFTASNLKVAIGKRYAQSLYILGGGDIADPYQLAIERAVVSSSWSENPNVERNIILIVDRPPKDPYEYNICNSTVRQWMHFPDVDGYKNCYSNFNREVWQKVLVPETCETIHKVIMESICMNPLMAPSYTQMNKRTLEDEIKLAQAYDTKISVVIPHKFDPQIHAGNKLSDPVVRDKLRYLAEATGGKFIYYDQRTQYTPTLLQDTLRQVFTKQPRSLKAVADGEDPPQVLALKTNTPTVLDVSRSGVVAQNYKWDFDDNGIWDETTPGPVTEHEFSSPGQGLFRAQALAANGSVLAETRQIYTVSVREESVPERPTLPQEIKAEQQADGNILVTWSPEETNKLVVFDPETNLPIGAAPLVEGSLTIPLPYESLDVRVISETAASDELTVPVSLYVEPPAPIIVELPIAQVVDGAPPITLNDVPETEPEVLPAVNVAQANTSQRPVNKTVSQPTQSSTNIDPPIVNATQAQNFPNSAIDTVTTPKVEGLSVGRKSPIPLTSTPALTPKKPTTKPDNWWVIVLISGLTVAIYTAVRRARK